MVILIVLESICESNYGYLLINYITVNNERSINLIAAPIISYTVPKLWKYTQIISQWL